MSSQKKESSPAAEIIISGAKGLAIGIITAAVLLFGLTAIAYNMENPDSLTSPLGYLALYVSAAVSGGVASRMSGDTGGVAVLSAAISGVMLLFILILMSFLPAEAAPEALSPLMKVLMYAAVPAASALSGLVLRRKRVRRIKHKRRR